MHNRNPKLLIWGAVTIVVIAGITGFIIYNNDLISKAPPGLYAYGERDALRNVIDAANRNSGIESGAVFNYAFAEHKSNATNFGILLCRDEVRCDSVVNREVAVWRQPNTPSDDTAEIDTQTHHVVSFHREIPDFVGNGNYPEAKLENKVRQFLSEVYPEFASIESSLTFDPGMKGTRLNNGNYFFRWNDERFALPTGLSMDIPPFLQVSITTGGFIFSYDNTIPLYREPLRDDLRKLCAYVEMPFSDDSAIDTGNGIVTVWYMDKQNNNRYLLLPYEPRTDFEGCSESAKEKLEHIREVDDRNRASGFYD